MAMRVLSIGECMAELAPLETAGNFRLGFAGDTFNTAWYLARVRPETAVSYLTAIGTDTISDQLRAQMVHAGINDRYVMTVADRTVGLYMISLDNGERSFSYWRGMSAARQLASDPNLLENALDAHDVAYFSGITLAILDPASRIVLLDALRDARANGKTIVFDPNLRPRLWESTSTMTQTIMAGAAVSDITLPSFEDEATWFADVDPQATVARYRDAGAATVVVKNGAGSVFYCEPDSSGTVTVPTVESPTDTTAAGDSFNAGFLAGLHDQKPVKDCISTGCRLSALVIQARGALVEVDPAFDRI